MAGRREYDRAMDIADVAFLAILVAFFGLAVLLVHGCERILRPDETVAVPQDTNDVARSGRAA